MRNAKNVELLSPLIRPDTKIPNLYDNPAIINSKILRLERGRGGKYVVLSRRQLFIAIKIFRWKAVGVFDGRQKTVASDDPNN